MMTALKIVAGVVAAVVVVVLILAMTKPSSFRVERSTVVNAPPEKAYAQLEDFHRWAAWSPWEKMDPDMKKTFSGAASGKGAVYAWESQKVGTGRMEILEAAPASKLVIKLDFLKPFEGHNQAEFTLDGKGGATTVTWAMSGPLAFVPRVMSVFMSMDAMIGKDFESGLANLKALAEK